LSDIKEVQTISIPDCDIVIGGFPCQGFSQANMNKSSDDDRNKLYLEFVRVVKDKKPLYFVAENVRGLVSMDKGAAIKRITNDFETLGYNVAYKVFNAADFGVPQNRNRVIIIGVCQDIFTGTFPFPIPTHSAKNNLLYLPHFTISQALKDIPEPDTPHNLINHIYSKYKVTDRNFIGHRMTDPNKPSPTIFNNGLIGKLAKITKSR
jgi:DNA (cytosine-5)-methyltransferase 1